MTAARVLVLDTDSYVNHRTFVNGRSRDVIMEEMRQRIDRADKEKEITEAIQVCAVARTS
jgi:2-oxo-4-hydroxy-4-carboxy--5-ureidoimidazoline (OHCU) decarboxylase